jgi:hypothetical protein
MSIQPFIQNIQQTSNPGPSKDENPYCEFVYNKVDDIENEKGFQSFMAKLLKDVTENNKKKLAVVELENPDASKIKQQSLVAREKVFKMRGGKKRRVSVKKKGKSNKTKRRRN